MKAWEEVAFDRKHWPFLITQPLENGAVMDGLVWFYAFDEKYDVQVISCFACNKPQFLVKGKRNNSCDLIYLAKNREQAVLLSSDVDDNIKRKT